MIPTRNSNMLESLLRKATIRQIKTSNMQVKTLKHAFDKAFYFKYLSNQNKQIKSVQFIVELVDVS